MQPQSTCEPTLIQYKNAFIFTRSWIPAKEYFNSSRKQLVSLMLAFFFVPFISSVLRFELSRVNKIEGKKNLVSTNWAGVSGA